MITQSPFASALNFIWPRAARPSNSDHKIIPQVRAAADDFSQLADSDLPARYDELRRIVAAGRSVTDNDVLVPAFGLAVEAMRRMMNVTLYDVQLLGGLALARGRIAEMQTGEGKTFVALLPAALHALAGSGVHVMTVNAYLARRDGELLTPVFEKLGISVGHVSSDADPAQKRTAYACDVTYGPGYEFGFDYLRDQVALLSARKQQLGESYRTLLRGGSLERPQPMQRGHAVAIVDEADSVLIDEATTPLILSGGGRQPAGNADVYLVAAQASRQLEHERDFIIDEAFNSLRLTRRGTEQLATQSSEIPRRGLDRPWATYVEQALRAQRLFHRDVHYVVRDDEILLVDQYTGRIFADRSWRDGLQQAVQAKESVTITTETKSIARITRQRYFQLYDQVCGMTGTAQGSERELRSVFGLEVSVIPPHRPCLRQTLPLRTFDSCQRKLAAIVDEVERIRRSGQPVLVGTASIETSERLSSLLDERSVPHQLLNGKQDDEEADIVAQAGQRGTVTIATNMAGRGTDIKLGRGVAKLGGLHVIAAEPQESTRVDRQLVGRAARQGDPGSAQLFASADDSLFTRHAPPLARHIQRAAQASGEIALDVAQDILATQKQVERAAAQQRRQMFNQDDWLEGVLEVLASSK